MLKTKTGTYRVYYLREENRVPRGVLLIEQNKDSNVVRFGWSFRHEQDQWNRELALKIAEGRLMKSGKILRLKEGETAIKRIVQEIAQSDTREFHYVKHVAQRHVEYWEKEAQAKKTEKTETPVAEPAEPHFQ